MKKGLSIIFIIIVSLSVFWLGFDYKEIEEPITPPKEEKKSPLEMSLSEFTLEGYFEGTVLTEKEVDDDYMSNIIYAGDSVALYYTINKINKKEVWHQISINPKTAQTCDVYVNSVKKYSSYVELFKEKQPEIVIMTMGTNGVSTMDKDYFIEQLDGEIAKCTSKKEIIISPEIIQFKRETIEYVIAHEFCHLKYKTHSKGFFEMMERYMEDYDYYDCILNVA